MRCLLLLPVLLVLASCKEKKTVVPFTAENAIAVASPEAAYVNEHFQFKIEGLPQTWKIMGREELDSILPDATVGGARVGGIFSAVIVEPIGDAELGDYSRLIADNLSANLGAGEIEEFEDLTFAGEEARSFQTDAVLGGITFHYRFITLVYKGFGYQLVSWHAKDVGRGDPKALAEFTDCFAFLGGQPTLPPVEALPDMVNQGGRLKDGRFESGVFRLALNPTENWRVVAGLSLANMALDALVGLEAPQHGTYLTVRASHQGDLHPGTLRDQLAGYIAATLADPAAALPAEDITLQVAGEPVTFLSHLVPGAIESRFYNAVVCRNGIVYNIEAWHLSNTRNADSLLQEALDGWEFLDADRAAAVKAEIASTVTVPASVGPDYSFRNGTYRNFGANCLWRAPHAFWQVYTGDDAVAMNPSSSLWAVDLETNVNLQLITEEAGGFTPEAYHDAIMAYMAEGEIDPLVEELPPLDLDGVPARLARISLNTGPDALTYQVATAVHNGQAYQFLAWARPSVISTHQEAVMAALSAFRMPDPALQATTPGTSSYRDDRLGWQLDFPGSGWTSKVELTGLSPIGNVVQFHKGPNFLQVLGLNLEPGADIERIINRMVSDSLQVNFDRSSSEGANTTTGRFAGHEARLLEATTDGMHMRVATFTGDGMLWMLMAGSDSERRANTAFATLESGFQLLP